MSRPVGEKEIDNCDYTRRLWSGFIYATLCFSAFSLLHLHCSLRYKNVCIMKGFCFSGCQGECSPKSNGPSYSCPCDFNQNPFIPPPYYQCPYYCLGDSQ